MSIPGGRAQFLSGLIAAVLVVGMAGGLGRAEPLFPYQSPLVGAAPKDVIAVDVNGDGHPDLVTANQASNDISVLIARGDGTFETERRFAAGSGPRGVAGGDFNGDGRMDLAVANATSGDITLLLGGGAVDFAPAGSLAAAGGLVGIAAADFDLDGKVDLVVAGASPMNLLSFLGHGDGTFAAQPAIALEGEPADLIVDDFNGDTRSDVVVSLSDSYKVVTYLGTGTGSFGSPIESSLGFRPNQLASGNLDGDLRHDLVVCNFTSNQSDERVTVLRGLGDGTFTRVVSPVPEPFGPSGVVLRDLNADGRDDLVLLSGGMSIYPGSGDFTFGSPVLARTGRLPSSVAAADFDGDGDPDLAVAEDHFDYLPGAVGISLNHGDLRFEGVPAVFTGDSSNLAGAVGDFDEDGNQDLAVGNVGVSQGGPPTAHVLRGQGDGTFGDGGRFAFRPDTGFTPWGLVSADFNEDGHDDLAGTQATWVSGLRSTVGLLLGRGNGSRNDPARGNGRLSPLDGEG